MIDADLRTLLRRWGRVFGEPPPPEWDEDSSAGSSGSTHVLLNAMRVGKGLVRRRVEPRWREYSDADGEVRLERAPEHRCFGRESAATGRGWVADASVERVERFALQLYSTDPLAGLVLRANYCIRGARLRRVAWVNTRLAGFRISRRRYVSILEAAHAYIHSEMNPKVKAA